jgi:membrane protease YdiL (CAAX protease family)
LPEEDYLLLLKKFGIKNYFIALILLLGLTMILVITAFAVSALIPDSLGNRPNSMQFRSASAFEPWSFEINELNIDFPGGGIIIPVDDADRKTCFILIGPGEHQKKGQPLENDQLFGVFMALEHQMFDELRGSNIFTPLEDAETLRHAESIFNKQIGIPAIWKDTVPLSFYARENVVYYYFMAEDGEPILPPQTNTSALSVAGAFVLYSLFIAIAIMVITIFSIDHRYSRYWYLLRKTQPNSFSMIMVPLIALSIFSSELVTTWFEWPLIYAAGGYIAALFALILSAKYGKIDYLDMGMRRDRLRYGYLMAIITALLIVGVVGGFPSGLQFGGLKTFLYLPLIYVIIGLTREMLWRGYIQKMLSRQFGPTKGFVLMVLMAALVHLAIMTITTPWMLVYPYAYLEVLVLVPGMAAILGYLYLRTENILACALLHTLILWLPGIILY